MTGAGGFVGANLVRYLADKNYEVAALAHGKRLPWRLQGLEGKCSIYHADLCNQEAIRKALLEFRPNQVFHLAAYGAYPEQNDLKKAVLTNIVGFQNLLVACKEAGVASVVNAGSSSEYGSCDHAPLESELAHPNSFYAISKVAATNIGAFTGGNLALNVCTCRLYSVYGPYEEPRRLIPTLLMHAYEGVFPPFADASISRDFIYVDDACDAFVKAANHQHANPGEIYNIGSGVQTNLGQVAAIAKEQFNLEGEPQFGSMPNRRWDATVWYGDASKAAQALNWWATTSLTEGLRRSYAWLCETEHFKRYKLGVYRSKT